MIRVVHPGSRIRMLTFYQCCGSGSGIRDWVPFWPLDPGSGIRDGRQSASGSGIRDEQPGSYFLELRNHFFAFLGVKMLKFFYEDPGSGMETVRIRDGKKSDPGSGINIPDPQHCFLPIPDPGSRGQKGNRSRIRIRNTEICHSNMFWRTPGIACQVVYLIFCMQVFV